MELLRAQAGECLYTGEKLIPENLDQYEIDHIVPRSKGGPDAAFNYALTTRHSNHDLKGEQTPFEWLGTTNQWDAFVNRVRRLGTVLRNKKMKLLTSPDAVELADRYTALAETAWVAKLSQAIIALHFGWRGGIDDLKRRKITVVSGGLTARIRRKYRLNGLLYPSAQTEEEAEKKNRDDDRHHALDAMVINFIPGWTRDAAKEHFFRFPAEVHRNAREFFGREIAQVVPENICFEKPRLEETIYGIDRSEKAMVQRVELRKLAYRPINPSKSTYDLKYAAKQIRCIRDEHIKQLLLDFLDQDPPEPMWNQFCDDFRLMQKDGSPGSRVTHVRMEAGEPEEFRDLSKDGTGAYRKGDKHQGFILYQTGAGGKAEPVYAFESKHQKMTAVRDSTGSEAIVAFVESGCVLKIDEAISAATPAMPRGQYIFTSISNKRTAKFKDARNQVYRCSVKNLIAAGVHRLG